MGAKPYVGVTGVANKEEVEGVCRKFADTGYTMDSGRIPMLGFLVSYETLNREKAPNRRYPNVDILPELLRATRGSVLTMIHYRSRQVDTLSEQVNRLFNGIYENGLCRAIQFNIVWPDRGQIRDVKESFPGMSIVFCASEKTILNRSPRELAEAIGDYGNLLDHCLIDPSGGRGIEFDLERSLEIYLELRQAVPDLTIGFAGGFTCENTASRLQDIAKRVGANFSIDAEGGLRDKITEKEGDDSLNIVKVEAYLKAASRIFERS
ncbi:MAG TPA: hypothetical protein VJB06_00625 [archaeon]|nr:hypothetical protein [archaeon]